MSNYPCNYMNYGAGDSRPLYHSPELHMAEWPQGPESVCAVVGCGLGWTPALVCVPCWRNNDTVNELRNATPFETFRWRTNKFKNWLLLFQIHLDIVTAFMFLYSICIIIFFTFCF